MQKWFRLFESIHYWIIEIISILLDVKNEEVSSSEVEICALARYSSQLQLSPGSEIVVGPLVGPEKLSYFPASEFSETWSEVTGG